MTRKILLVVSGLAVALTLLWCQASLGKEQICKNLTYGFSSYGSPVLYIPWFCKSLLITVQCAHKDFDTAPAF